MLLSELDRKYNCISKLFTHKTHARQTLCMKLIETKLQLYGKIETLNANHRGSADTPTGSVSKVSN